MTQIHSLQKKVIRSKTLYLFLFFSFVTSAAPAWSRDLQGRIGVGFNGQFANRSALGGQPALSLKYALSRDIAGQLIAGINTTSPANTVIGAKLYKNIFLESNLNFYMTLGAGVMSANSLSGFQLLGGMGAEFFIPGLESLGWSFEAGASVDNLSGSFAIKTLGLSFLEAGMHFYF